MKDSNRGARGRKLKSRLAMISEMIYTISREFTTVIAEF